MCKLCNSDRPPATNTIQMSSDLIKFIEIVKEYIGEYSCSHCNYAYLRSLRHKNGTAAKSIDDYIYHRKLFIHYTRNLGISRNSLKKSKSKIYDPNWDNKNKERHKAWREATDYVPKCYTVKTTVEPHIVQNKCKSLTSYTFRINSNTLKICPYSVCKTFKTLAEARQFKQEVLNGNYTNTTR